MWKIEGKKRKKLLIVEQETMICKTGASENWNVVNIIMYWRGIHVFKLDNIVKAKFVSGMVLYMDAPKQKCDNLVGQYHLWKLITNNAFNKNWLFLKFPYALLTPIYYKCQKNLVLKIWD